VPKKTLAIDQVLIILAETPPEIAELSAGLEPAQLHAKPSTNEWSANGVLGHLRACADVWGGGIGTIISQDWPTIRAVNPRTYINTTDYLEQEFHRSLQTFTAQRADLLALLNPLRREAWSRKATVTGAGKPLRWTVLYYARRLAGHERAHVKQINQIVRMVRR